MAKEKKSKAGTLLLLFVLFLKIGLFTFGGGYAMISLIRREFVDKRKWVTAEEFVDMIAISESTPGPLAINSATYVGFKIGGFGGALCATVGVVIPSFVIIYVISLFLERFLALKVVAAAFKGIQVAVAFLILMAGVKLFREMEKKPLTLILAGAVFVVMILFDIFAISFSSVYLIFIGAAIGLIVYLFCRLRQRGGKPPAAGAAEGQKGTEGTSSSAEEQRQETKILPCGANGQDGHKDDQSLSSAVQESQAAKEGALCSNEEKKEGK